MKNPTQHLIAEVPRRQSQGKLTIGIDLGDVWSHYCTLNEDGEVVDRGRPNHSQGSREVVYRSTVSASGDGSRDPFDLDQRATAGTWP